MWGEGDTMLIVKYYGNLSLKWHFFKKEGCIK